MLIGGGGHLIVVVVGHELRSELEDSKNVQESSIKQLIQRAPPASFLSMNSGKLHGSASNDIVLMAALKGNGNTLLKEEELEEELVREKKKEEEKIIEEEIETELEKENEEVLLEEQNPNLLPELERERLIEEEVEAEREAVLLEEGGGGYPIDHQYSNPRRLIHAYVGEDGRMHYEPMSYSLGHQNYYGNHMGNHMGNQNYYGNHMGGYMGNHMGTGNHLAHLLSRCLPTKLHHLIEQCREHSINYHHF